MVGQKVAKIGIVALVVAVGLMAFTSSARADVWDFRDKDAWGNDRRGDHFTTTNDRDVWHEVIKGKVTYRFQVIQRTPDFVNLYDASRRVQVVIYYKGGEAFIKFPGSEVGNPEPQGFILFAKGTYKF